MKEWPAAALKEIRQLERKGIWTECLKSEAKGEQIIPCAWVFQHKRNPAREIIKCGVRICSRGDLMTNDSKSCAPAVQWSTICFFIICLIHLRWMIRSVNWVKAFPRAPPDKPTLMRTPRGFMKKCGEDRCLKAVQSLCGSKFAPRTWHPHLCKALFSRLICTCMSIQATKQKMITLQIELTSNKVQTFCPWTETLLVVVHP